jgi:acyl carrier protein
VGKGLGVTAAVSQDRIRQALYRAVDAIAPELPRGKNLLKSPDTVLLGDASPLDSLGLVNLIVAVEQAVEEEFGTPLSLLDEAQLQPEDSPLRSLGTLAAHLQLRLAEAAA